MANGYTRYVGARCAGCRRPCCWPARVTEYSPSTARTFFRRTPSPLMCHPVVLRPRPLGADRSPCRNRVSAIHNYAFDFGTFTLAGSPGTAESPVAFCARRTGARPAPRRRGG